MDQDGLLDEAAGELRRAADLLSAGRLAEADEHQKRAASLARTARKQGAGRGASEARFVHRQPEREAAAEALTELDAIATPSVIVEYAAARFGRELSSSSFSTIRRDERRAWNVSDQTEGVGARYRPAFVVPALDGARFTPARGLLALSSWETWRRIVGPRTLRVEHLRAALSVLSQWRWLEKSGADVAKTRLRRLLDELVRTVPGAMQAAQARDLERAEAAVRLELDQLVDDDREWRVAAAHRAERQLDREELLWGSAGLRIIEGKAQ